MKLEIPTDNLYKFMAIFGLVYTLFIMTLMYIQVTHLYSRYIELTIKKVSFNAKIQTEKKLVEQDEENKKTQYGELMKLPSSVLDKAANALEKAHSSEKKMENLKNAVGDYYADKIIVIKTFTQLDDEQEHLLAHDAVKQISQPAIQIEIDTAVLKAIKHLTFLMLIIYCFLLIPGIIIMISGFILWNEKVQKYQDLALKKSVN